MTERAGDGMGHRPASYAEFWPRYLGTHRKAGSRALHFAGTGLAIALVAGAIATADWRLAVAAPLAGYGAAWAGHYLVEGNRPETFGHPFWSLFSDLRMLSLWLLGGLAAEFRRHGIEPN